MAIYSWTMEKKENRQPFQRLLNTDSELTIVPMNPKLPIWSAHPSESLWMLDNKRCYNNIHLMLEAVEL